MKKSSLLNAEISYLISKMGHMDSLTIGDAGLPIPETTQRIDLAVSKGIPGFLQVLEVILSEQQVEMAIMAEEIKERSKELHSQILDQLHGTEERDNIEIKILYVPHEEFKARTSQCKAVVRTGEFTPYANIILVSGVVF